MKNQLAIILIFLFFVSGHFVNAQNNAFLASTTCGLVVDIEPLNNGYLLLSQSHWAKLDSAGKVLNSISYNLSFEGAKFLADKSFIAVGHTRHNVAFAIKLDSNGNKKWAKSYTLPNNYDLEASASSYVYISPSYNGGYWLTGNVYDSVKQIISGLIMKIDTGGDILSTELITSADTSAKSWYCYGVGPVVYGPDGSNYFALTANMFENGNNCGLLKTDSMLNMKWVKNIPAFAVTNNGMIMVKNQLYFASATYNNINNLAYMAVMGVDTGGNPGNQLVLQNTNPGNFNCIHETSDSDFIVTGSVMSFSRYNYIPILAQTDGSLNLKRLMTYPTYPFTTLNDYSNDVKETRNGYVLGGTHIIKTDKSGNSGCNDSAITSGPNSNYGITNLHVYFIPISITTTNTLVSGSVIADKDSLLCYTVLGINNIEGDARNLKVFPNPSHGVFVVKFSDITPISSIEIFNLLGERISILKTPKPGNEYNIDLNTRPEGIYFYRISAENGMLLGSGKISIIR